MELSWPLSRGCRSVVGCVLFGGDMPAPQALLLDRDPACIAQAPGSPTSDLVT